jgi:hypothetical protein
MFAAATCVPSGVNVTLKTGGSCSLASTRSPEFVSNTFNVGSALGAGSYFSPPGKY